MAIPILPIVLPVILGAAGTLIGKHFQEQAARIRAETEHNHDRLDKASALFNEISASVDALAFFSKDAMWASARPDQRSCPEREAAWNRYQEAWIYWKTLQRKHIAQTAQYFGSDAADILKEIQKGFDKLEDYVVATYRGKDDSKHFLIGKTHEETDKRVGDKYYPIQAVLDTKMTCLSTKMIERIEELSSSRGIIPFSTKMIERIRKLIPAGVDDGASKVGVCRPVEAANPN